MKLRLARGKSDIGRDLNGLGFIALNVADVWLTKIALTLGAGEVNPVMAFLCDNMEAKIIASVIVVFVIWLLGRDRLLKLLNAGMALIVIWNLTVIIRIISE